MHAADDAPDGLLYGPHDQLRHDLKTPLTTISGHAQLLARAVRRSTSLTDEEGVKMLAALTAVECAVREMVTLLDALGSPASGGSADASRMKR
jgi:signal transduction histidine kinase